MSMDKFSKNLLSKLQLESSRLAGDQTHRNDSSMHNLEERSKNLTNSIINSSMIKSVILRNSSVGKSQYAPTDRTQNISIKPLVLEERKPEDFTPKIQTVR
jgi:hypothetical protein